MDYSTNHWTFNTSSLAVFSLKTNVRLGISSVVRWFNMARSRAEVMKAASELTIVVIVMGAALDKQENLANSAT